MIKENKKIIFALFFAIGILLSVSLVSAYIRSVPDGSNYNRAGGFGAFSGAQSLKIDQSMCEQGSDFLIQMTPLGCTPAVVRSDLLEEQDVPIYCQLGATQINPLVDVKAINYISFTGQTPREVSGIGFYPSKAALGVQDGTLNSPILDNIGYAIIMLKRQPNESALTNCEKSDLGGEVCWVEGNLTAKISYDVENAFGIGESVFYLPVMDDDEWRSNYIQYGFWDGRGFLRAEGIGNGEATISIYADQSVRSGLSRYETEYNKAKYLSANLKEGGTSQELYLSGFSTCLATFNLVLNDIQNPDTMAKIKVNDDYVQLIKGEKFLENRCTITDIEKRGINSKISITCKEDEKQTKFNLRIFPKVSLNIDGKVGSYQVGDWLYRSADGEKSVYLGYVGTNPETTRIDDLYVYLVALPEHKDKLTDSEISSVASHANSIMSSSSSGAAFGDAALDFLRGASGTIMQIGKWAIKGESFSFISYKKGTSVSQAVSVEGHSVAISGFSNAENNEELAEGESKLYYEKAVSDFESILNSFSDEKEKENSIQTLGEKALYEEMLLAEALGQKKTMLELCQKFAENYPNSDENIEICTDNSKLANSEISVREITVNAISKRISFEGIYEPSFQDYGAKLIVQGPNGKTQSFDLRKNNIVYLTGFRNNAGNLGQIESVRLDSITSDTAQIKLDLGDQSFYENQFVSDTKTFKKDISDRYGGYTFTLTEVNLNQVAKVSIKPNIQYAKTETSFKFRVGIEKRGIQLSPEVASRKINALNNSIEDIQKASDALGGVVKTMKTACLGVGATLTLKNLISNSGGKSIARQKAMQGKGGWTERCTEMVSQKIYPSLDKCFLENSDAIDSEVDTIYNYIEYQNNEIKTIEADNIRESSGLLSGKYVDTQGFAEDYSAKIREALDNLPAEQKNAIDIENFKKILTADGAKNNIYTIDQLKEIELYSLYLKDHPQDSAAQTRLASVLTDIKNNAGNFVERMTFADKTGMGENSVVDSVEKITKLKEVKVTNGLQFSQTKYSSSGINPNDYVYAIRDKTSGNEYLVSYDSDGVVKNTFSITSSGALQAYKDNLGNTKINPFDLYFKKYDRSSYENNYKASSGDTRPLLRYYDSGAYKGYPAVVPFDLQNGWYAGTKPVTSVGGNIAAYDASGVVKSFWLCNVGQNGIEEFQVGYGDDICQMFNLATGQRYTQFSGLSESETLTLVTKANNAIEAAQRAYKDGVNSVTIDGKRIHVGSPAVETSTIQCQDFMSPKDCNVLFNVCDPVICPSSRCDLGGTYPVKDVIQSGIIGSIALCLPNAQEGIYVPVCVSGVQAGLDSWLSVQKSYRDCLQANLDTGETIGICDEIHSVYSCEFFWKQSIPVVKAALPKILGKLLGQNTRGGGEYLGVASAWENAENSIDYFKQYYAENSFRAFRVRSTDDAGSEVCKNFVSLTYPDSGSFLDNFVEPDSPAQFTGGFEEISFTTVTNPPSSQYKVYYHIYAGKDTGAYFQVYLRGSGSSFYQDTALNRMVGSGYIPKGEYKSETTDFTAPSGYQQLCIVVNGQEECGFKSVSTSFAANYVKDLYLAEQASSSNIKTESECISGSASLYNILNLNAQSAAENLINPAVYNQGLIRVCSTDNPGKGTDAKADTEGSRWKQVGYCGNAQIKCWVDTNSIENIIKSIDIEDQTLQELTQSYLNYVGNGTYLKNNEFAVKLTEINNETSDLKKIVLVNEIFNKVFLNNQKAQLFLLRGMSYSRLAIGSYKKVIEAKQDAEAEGIEETVICTPVIVPEIISSLSSSRDKVLKAAEELEGSLAFIGPYSCYSAATYVYEYAGVDAKCAYSDKSGREYTLSNENNAKVSVGVSKNSAGSILYLVSNSCERIDMSQSEKINRIQPGDQLDIVWNSGAGHSVIFIEWIDKSKGYAKVFDWMGKTLKEGEKDAKGNVCDKAHLFNGNCKQYTYHNIYLTEDIHPVYLYRSPYLAGETSGSTTTNNGGSTTGGINPNAPTSLETGQYDKINYPYTSYSQVKLDEFSDNERNLFLNAKTCNECGDGLFNLCDKDECKTIELKIGKDCYYSESIIGIGSCEEQILDEAVFTSMLNSISASQTLVGGAKCLCGQNCANYAKWIKEASEQYNEDGLLLLAIAIQESGCSAGAVSASDAGLMQINLDVHCGKTGNLPSDRADCRALLLNEPRTNIQIGASILKSNYNTYKDGRTFSCDGKSVTYYAWEAALRGYNGWGCTGADNYVEEVKQKYERLVDLYNLAA